MSDYQSEVGKLLDFTENVLINLLNNKDASQSSFVQRAMIETKLRKSSRDRSKFQRLIKRRQLHKVPLDIVKEEIMDYDDILPFQRLSKYFSHYVDADRMDQVEFDTKVDSYIRKNKKCGFKNEEKTKTPSVNRITISSRGKQLQNQSSSTISNVAPNNNSPRLQKAQDISISTNHDNNPEYKTRPLNLVGNEPVRLLKEKVEIKASDAKINNPVIIKQQPKLVLSYTNTFKPINQISNTNVQYINEDKTNKTIKKEDNHAKTTATASTKLSDEKKSNLINKKDIQSGINDTSNSNKVYGNSIDLKSTKVTDVATKSGSMNRMFEKGQLIKVMEEIVYSQNKELENTNMIINNTLEYFHKRSSNEFKNSVKSANEKLKSLSESVNKEVKSLDKIPDKEVKENEQNVILIKDKNNKILEEKQYISAKNIETNDGRVLSSSTEEAKKSVSTINTNKISMYNLSNKVEQEKSSDDNWIISVSDSNQLRIGDKRKLKTKDQTKSHKKSKRKINTNKKTNNSSNTDSNNKIEKLIERIQNSKITLETLLGSVSNETTFEQFHEVEPPSPKVFENENKNKDGNNIRLMQLYDSITKSDERDEEFPESVRGEIHVGDSKQLHNQTYNGAISAVTDNHSDNVDKVGIISNNMFTDKNDTKENIPLNQSILNASQSLYDAYMSNHNSGLLHPTTDKNSLSTKNPFITSHRNKQKTNKFSSVQLSKHMVNKKVPKALKKISNLVSKYNLDDT
ncbi:uncharacterized protein PWA37_004953 [Arxiozyma heterogenica]|uniref:Uncharacterized protein n=1 Tax=Arxiozyma heterogenica TaxID=278026 RepID=A0AAN8A5X1_9SACH|nr:hypothetical protein RI543_004981 [Kazachstania heterogenica]